MPALVAYFMRLLWVLMAVLCGLSAAAAQDASPTLQRIRDRGELYCGVMRNLQTTQYGPWNFYAEFCHAIAAAVLGSAKAVSYHELELPNWFSAVRNGEVDVLLGPVSRTLRREAMLGIEFAGTVYYANQSVLARRELGLRSLRDAHGRVICVQKGSTSYDALLDYTARKTIKLQLKEYETGTGRWEALRAGACDMMVSDHLLLVIGRIDRHMEATFDLLPESFGLEPQGPVVASGDPAWRKIVEWVMHALILADEHDISGRAVGTVSDHPNGEVQRMLGLVPGLGAALGLDDQWARRAIAAAGNYQEIFDRNLRMPLGIPQGVNAPIGRGGLFVIPQFR